MKGREFNNMGNKAKVMDEGFPNYFVYEFIYLFNFLSISGNTFSFCY